MTRSYNILASSGIFLRFLQYFSPILKKERKLISSSLAVMLAEVVLQILQPWPLKFIVDRIAGQDASAHLAFPLIESLDTISLITVSAAALVAIAALRALACYSSTIGFAIVGNRVLTEVRNILYRHIQYLSLSFHTKSRSGDLILRVMSDVGMLKEIAVTAFLPLLGNVLVLIGIFVVMFWLHWQLALLALAVTPFFFFSAARKSRQIRDIARKQRKREGVMAATAAESIGAIKEVQALSLSDIFINSFHNQSNKTLKQDVKAKRLQTSLTRTVDVLIAVATALVMSYGATLVLGNELTLGELVVFLSYLGTAFRPLKDVAKYTGRIAKASAACERVLEVFESKLEVYDLPGAIEAPPFSGEVRFENVRFAYEPGNIVLDNINFKIASGQCVAIVGPSGTGKSTLVSLILRLYDCIEGRVLIDGHDIRDYTLDSLRRQISAVLQDNVLFAVSVKDNIAYGAANATDEEIEAAARLANADQFIRMLPNGYETILGERGVTISKGQRQRIAIARAAIRKVPILILDEPTTGLDAENEQLVIEAMERLEQRQRRTNFLVTHDLQHASRSDLIVYLEEGRIVESGTHEDLIALNGKYAALYKLQRTIDTSH